MSYKRGRRASFYNYLLDRWKDPDKRTEAINVVVSQVKTLQAAPVEEEATTTTAGEAANKVSPQAARTTSSSAVAETAEVEVKAVTDLEAPSLRRPSLSRAPAQGRHVRS
jgi:hypothetical protein